MSKIILVGSHGTGKTTLTKAFKEKHPECCIRDGISRPIRKIKDRVGLNNKEEQIIVNELTFFYFDYNKDIENVMMTRSPLDLVAYCRCQGWEDLAKECEERIKTLNFKGLIFAYVPIEFEIEDDGVRFTDKEFQRDIDMELLRQLKYLNIPYIVLHGEVEERVKQLEKVYL